MKEILFVIGSLDIGGAERVISTLANNFCKEYKITIVTMLSDKHEYKLDSSINVVNLLKNEDNRILKLPGLLSRLSRMFKKLDKKNSVIVSFIARINIVVLLANMFIRVPLILSERNDPKNDERGAFIKPLIALLYKQADRIVFQTAYAKSLFSKAIQNMSIVIYNPVSVEAEKCADSERKEIVTAGRLAKQKNHTLLINAFKKIFDKYSEYTLNIYGVGPLRSQLEKYIIALNLQDRVILKGNSSDLHKEIAGSAMFVLSSNFEGQSNALLEAMMMGLPCIATNTPGTDELLNATNSILVDVGDEQQMTDAIEYFIQNPNIRKEIGENAKKVVSLVGKDIIISQWKSLIAEIIE